MMGKPMLSLVKKKKKKRKKKKARIISETLQIKNSQAYNQRGGRWGRGWGVGDLRHMYDNFSHLITNPFISTSNYNNQTEG